MLHYGTFCTKRFYSHRHSTNKLLSLVGSHPCHIRVAPFVSFLVETEIERGIGTFPSFLFAASIIYTSPLGCTVCTEKKRHPSLCCSDIRVQRALGRCVRERLIAGEDLLHLLEPFFVPFCAD